MTKNIEGNVEYEVGPERFTTEERYEVGRRAVEMAHRHQSQLPPSEGELAQYSVQISPFSDTVLRLCLRQDLTEQYEPFAAAIDSFAEAFENSFDEPMKQRVVAARGASEMGPGANSIR